jgi:hypothetical protein
MTDGALYRAVLGDAFAVLPPEIRELHDLPAGSMASGTADVDGAKGMFARLLARLIGLPPTGRRIPVTVRFTKRAGREIWERSFDGRRFRSVQVRGRRPGSLIERFGPASFDLLLSGHSNGLLMILTGARLAGIPMPKALWPIVAAEETVEDGCFTFDVRVAHRWTGLLVRYRGHLVPDCRGS